MGLKARKFNKDNLVEHVQAYESQYTDRYGNKVPVPKGTVTLYCYENLKDDEPVDAFRIIAHNKEAIVYYVREDDEQPVAQ